MSYQVIARKWRPKAFADLVGQPHISQTLLNALKNDRLPHALLFTGPRGTGKTTSARILAKSVRCMKAVDFIPCGECSDCLEVAAGSNLDVIEIDGASNNGVDAIRELRDTVGYMPSSGKYKVYIIDEVHMLSTSAFNALLKTLEEPPAHVIFVLATTEVHKIPNTILSRCQRFDFRRIPTRQISERLKVICEAEGVSASDEALWIVARQGDGSMRDSQSLLDQVVTFCSGEVTQEKVVDILGLTSRSLLLKTIECLIKSDLQELVGVVKDIFMAGYDPKIYVQDLLEELRHLLLVKVAPNRVKDVVDLPDSELQQLVEMSEELGQEEIHLLFDMALKGANEIFYAQDPRVVLEMLMFRMTAAPRIVDLTQLRQLNSLSGPATKATVATTELKKTAELKRTAEPKGAAERAPGAAGSEKTLGAEGATGTSEAAKVTKPSETATRSSTPLSTHATNKESLNTSVTDPQPPATEVTAPPRAEAPTGNLTHDWTGLVGRVKKVNGLIAAKLEHSYLLNISEDKIIQIGIPPKMKFLFEQVKDPHFQKKISNYVTTFWGPGYSIEVQLGDEKKSQVLTPKAIAHKQEQSDKDEMRQKIENHTLIKEAQTVFKSEIQSIKELK
ncbi:DNA polymerase III subunit gamma/tau [Bdellovibrionales bacterium]|nr:DNA polymerase III subunit gamma/tau [Bdellovibrionales bacterium]